MFRMLEKPYLSPQLIEFIQENLHRDLAELALQAKKYPELPMPFIIDQIYGKRKAKDKLPTWFLNDAVVYPPKISMEQCSSEQTANFKASLISGEKLLDLTGGLGVDDMAFAQHFNEVHYVEQREGLVDVVRQNAQTLQVDNLILHYADGIELLKNIQDNFDWIYLDPARRDAQNQKVVRLDDCQPNVLAIQDQLFEKAEDVLLKLSPMLDIKLAVNELKCVKQVWVVAVNNECKELLFWLRKEETHDVRLSCINLGKDNSVEKFEATLADELVAEVILTAPKGFIYEPNTAILKSGLYKSIAVEYGLNKLHAHSHLYTSDQAIEGFPGRTFKCSEVLKFNKKALLKAIPSKKANITVRNFPLTVAEIRKKIGFKDGGDIYIFATTTLEGSKVCLVCEKVY